MSHSTNPVKTTRGGSRVSAITRALDREAELPTPVQLLRTAEVTVDVEHSEVAREVTEQEVERGQAEERPQRK